MLNKIKIPLLLLHDHVYLLGNLWFEPLGLARENRRETRFWSPPKTRMYFKNRSSNAGHECFPLSWVGDREKYLKLLQAKEWKAEINRPLYEKWGFLYSQISYYTQ